MLPINEEIRTRADELGLDVEAAYLFCFALQHNLVGYLIEKQLITKQNEHDYRINFTEVNGDGEIVLRYPLYKQSVDATSFQSFFEKLKSTGMEINGYPFNAQKYSVFTRDEETVNNYNKLKMMIENFDEDKMVRVVQHYYSNVEQCKNLRNFLSTDAYTQYDL